MHYAKILAMMALTLLVSWVTTASELNPRIVGGQEATLNEFPYIVSLHERGQHICGGSLIKPNWVLTAAHCVSGTRISRVLVGLHDQANLGAAESIPVARIVRHPRYNSSTTDFDFALIQVSRNSAGQTVLLNDIDLEISEAQGRQSVATVAGWGEMRQMSILAAASRLQKVDVPLVSSVTCGSSYPNQITDQMICAGYPQGQKDSCFGDSGGPLVLRDPHGILRLVGVVSWGEGCARANKYGVYSKVSSVHDWIVQTAN
jgi:trypsin